MNKLDPSIYYQKGKDNFLNGYNCSQAVVLAFKDLINISEEELLKMSSPFGGGICRLRETCGAISGGLFVLGYLFGYSVANDDINKAKIYMIGQEFVSRFKEKYNFDKCYELLNKKPGKENPIPSKRTKEFYENRPCKNYIADACYILANFINEINHY